MAICRHLARACVFVSFFSVGLAIAQGGAATAKPQTPASGNPLAQLSADQRQAYSVAAQQFSTEHYADALAGFKRLIAELPAGPTRVFVSKAAAEAALNVEDFSFAKNALEPIADADANDWQAAGMLARLYAETGDAKARDAELAHIVELHKRAASPQIAQMKQILLERISVPNGSVRIWYSLEPVGLNKTYLFCRVYDVGGAEIFHIALESADYDQPLFAQQHPDLAAAGMRRFSLDGYGVGLKHVDGDNQHTHATIGFYDGQPPYDSVRQQIIDVASERNRAGVKGEGSKNQ
jgi:hypothetical protein